ncbi:hypothetical protein [Rhodococcus yananensis]|uniref:hypothetical protein n=1 Tax=Rhodococcus yananensis TaxID=2879464 RepID=UPI001CF8EA60|nr:hypothetical protein [Rhodococcus yananensis]
MSQQDVSLWEALGVSPDDTVPAVPDDVWSVAVTTATDPDTPAVDTDLVPGDAPGVDELGVDELGVDDPGADVDLFDESDPDGLTLSDPDGLTLSDPDGRLGSGDTEPDPFGADVADGDPGQAGFGSFDEGW